MAKANIVIQAPALLVDATAAARMLGICRRYFLQLNDMGRVPAPIRFGKRKLWSVQGLQQWAEKGCPNRNYQDGHLAKT